MLSSLSQSTFLSDYVALMAIRTFSDRVRTGAILKCARFAPVRLVCSSFRVSYSLCHGTISTNIHQPQATIVYSYRSLSSVHFGHEVRPLCSLESKNCHHTLSTATQIMARVENSLRTHAGLVFLRSAPDRTSSHLFLRFTYPHGAFSPM